MAVINDPNTAANIAAVGNKAYSPLHALAGPFPIGSGGGYRLSMQSGTMAVSLAANSEIFQFRYVTAAARVALVHGIAISAGPNVAASTAVLVGFFATIARAWTAAGSGGTRATMTGNNQKVRTSHNTSEVNDIGIATTGALTTGTKTLDAQNVGGIAFGIGTGAITTQVGLQWVPKTNLFGDVFAPISFPLILANQEGFVVRTGNAVFPAGATWTFIVDVAWSEVDAF